MPSVMDTRKEPTYRPSVCIHKYIIHALLVCVLNHWAVNILGYYPIYISKLYHYNVNSGYIHMEFSWSYCVFENLFLNNYNNYETCFLIYRTLSGRCSTVPKKTRLVKRNVRSVLKFRNQNQMSYEIDLGIVFFF